MRKRASTAARVAATLFLIGLIAATPVSAEEAWVAEMPSIEQVVEATQGTDTFDTAARQYVAFDSLFSMMVPLIGDRFVTEDMTPAEKALRDAYNGNRDRVLQELKSSLPEDQRAYTAGTRFAEWSALRDRYWSDPQFNDQLIEAFFSSAFRKDNSRILEDAWQHAGGLGVPPEPDLLTRATRFLAEYGLIALFIVGAILGGVGLRARLALDEKDVFKVFKGTTPYRLHHSTGVVEDSSKLGTTSVYSYGGSMHVDSAGNVTATPASVGSSTTIHDQFFLRQANGHLQPIQLRHWNVAVANGHVVSAVWAIADGNASGPYVAIRNHSTGQTKSDFGEAFPIGDHVIDSWGWLVLIAGCIGAAVGLANFTSAYAGDGHLLYPGLVPGLVVVFVSALLARAGWKSDAWRRVFGRFTRKDVPRLYQALNQEATRLA